MTIKTIQKVSREVSDAAAVRDNGELNIDDTHVGRNSKVRGGIEVLHIKADDSFNPYEREPEDRRNEGGKRDLRKLSEHIKLMREIEERKKRDGG